MVAVRSTWNSDGCSATTMRKMAMIASSAIRIFFNMAFLESLRFRARIERACVIVVTPAKASRVHPLAWSGKQSVQLAHLALVPGAGAFGPNVVMHGVKGDGELHPVSRRLQLNDSGDFVGRDARHEIGQSLIGQSAWRRDLGVSDLAFTC